MKNQLVFLSLLLVVVFAAWGGCTSSTTPSPMITLLSPQNGTVIPADAVTVSVQVSNFNIVDKQGQASVPGEGHVHFYMDAGTVPQTPGQPAIPSEKNVPWAHISGTSYTFTNVSPGMHTFTAQLVSNDHSPVIPLVYQIVTVNVEGQTPTAATTAPVTTMPATTLPGTTIPTTTMPVTTMSPDGGKMVRINLTAQNIAFDQSTLSAPAGSTVVMTFNNLDFGVTHNFALYTDLHATTSIFVGDFVTGTRTVTYTFTVPTTPGGYFFRCDVHPESMTGSFMVT